MAKCVLAFSGSLESLIAIPWLKERSDLDVVTISVDLGADLDLETLSEQALQAGAVSARVEDLRGPFYEEFVAPSLRALAHYQTYLLATALSRPLVARELVRVALEEGATHVAHLSSVHGNDQVRLEAAIRCLAPDLKVVSPQHEWEFRTREQALKFARGRRLTISAQEQAYKYDRNLWGQSIHGPALEDCNRPAPEEAFTLTRSPLAAPDAPEEVRIDFRAGLPVALDGRRLEGVALVEELSRRAGAHGLGRADIVEDRLVGQKSRELYEAPAATALYAAKRALEQMTLSRETLQVREGLSVAYGRCVYNGQWFTDLREALDAFFARTNQNVSGCVTVRFYKGGATVLGRCSEFSLYSKSVEEQGEVSAQQAAKGWTQIWTKTMMAESRRRKHGKPGQ
jgi:argininosuccinate synthase